MKRKILAILGLVMSFSICSSACGLFDETSTDSGISNSEESSDVSHVHTFTELHMDETYHWNECECGAIDESSKAEHAYETKFDENNHWEECECGHKINETAHVYGDWKTTDEKHWKECECGAISEEAIHSGGEMACTGAAVCEVCNQPYGKLGEHFYNVSKQDETYHWNECECGAIDESSKAEHAYETKFDENNHWEECECGHKINETAHVYGDWKTTDEKHWKECECGAISEEAAHNGGDESCTAQAVCVDCGSAYGVINENKHASETFNYTDNGDGTHSKIYDCCGSVVETVQHSGEWIESEGAKVLTCECGYTQTLPTSLTANIEIYPDATSAELDISALGNVTVCSALVDGVSFTGDEGAVEGSYVLNLTNREGISGLKTIILTVQTADGVEHSVSVFNVCFITKVITQASELSVLAYSNENNSTSGYYVLGNDIDASGVKCASGAYTWNQGFAGTFDGKGYTIYNLEVGQGGIFGQIYGGTVKNVNFVDVVINDTNNYVALFSSLNDNAKITNVNVFFASVTVNSASAYDTGLLFSRQLVNSTLKNVTVDASGMEVVSVFGSACTETTFENVIVYAKSVEELCNSAYADTKTAESAISTLAGVTVEYVNSYAIIVPEESDYFAFEGKTMVIENTDYTFTITPTVEGFDEFVVFVNGEEATLADGQYTVENVTEDLTIQVLHGYIEADEEYNVSVSYNGNVATVTNAVYTASGVGKEHGNAYISAEYLEYMAAQGYTKVQFSYVADGTTAAIAVAYYGDTVVAYITGGTEQTIAFDLTAGSNYELAFVGQNANGSGYAIQGQGGYVTITDLTFLKNRTIETAFYCEGSAITLEDEAFAVGDSYTVTANGESVSATVTTAGQLEVTFSSFTVGTTYAVTCEKDGEYITFKQVTLVTKVITQASELSVLAYSNENNSTSGYYVLGNDIDASGVKCASGAYTWNQGFAGTFDGCGYTIYNLEVGQGGIFGQIYGGTVKNVNFVDVVINDTNNYVALFSSLNDNAKITNVNVSFASVTVNSASAYDTGLLFSRQLMKSTLTNVTVDARGIDVVSVFGAACTGSTFENVVVYADSIAELYNTSTGGSKTTSTAVTSVSGVTVYVPSFYAVSVPSDSDYYTYTGASKVAEGENYTFSVTATVEDLDEFVVLVNGEAVTLTDEQYTVENVTEALTIQVLHGYIEGEEERNVSVAYSDNQIKITNAVFLSDATRAHADAYISAEYIDYMISQGYTKLTFTYVADGSIAATAVYRYNGSLVLCTTETAVTIDLVAGAGELELNGWNANNSGYAIMNQGGYVTITGLTFVR